MSRPPGAGEPAETPEEPTPSAAGTTVADRPKEEGPKHRPSKDEGRGGVLGFFRELPGLILVAFALALLIKTFLVQAFFIPSASMVPTLKVGDRVLVNKLVYDFGEPQRGDVIVFEDPDPTTDEPDRGFFGGIWHWFTEGLGFSTGQQQDFIKRVVGLPGETLELRGGKVYVNGDELDEPYILRPGHQDYGPVTIEPGQVFVMGDNRPNSSDSRMFGPVSEEKIIGKAFVLLWPLSRLEWLSDD